MRTIHSRKHKKTKGRSELAIESKISQLFYRVASEFPFLPSTNRYSITISHQNRFVWFRIPKVATNTIHEHLKMQKVYLDAEYAFLMNYPPKLYKKYFKFGFIRNPWDRLVSCWLNKVVLYNHFRFDQKTHQKFQQCFKSFVSFVSNIDIHNCDGHLKMQCSSIDLNEIDFIGRIENFNDDFLQICKQIGIEGRNVEVKNKTTEREDYKKYYDDDLKDRVFKIYEKDIRLFGYDF